MSSFKRYPFQGVLIDDRGGHISVLISGHNKKGSLCVRSVHVVSTSLSTPLQSDSDTIEAHAIISQCGPRDAKYLLEHLLDMALGLVSHYHLWLPVGSPGSPTYRGARVLSFPYL